MCHRTRSAIGACGGSLCSECQSLFMTPLNLAKVILATTFTESASAALLADFRACCTERD